MKITGIETWLVEIPLRGAFRNAHTVKSVQRSVVVRVRTEAGLLDGLRVPDTLTRVQRPAPV